MSSSTGIEPNGAGARISVSGSDAPAVALREGSAEDADLPLIERLAAGELEALHELYERHKSMAYSIALRITGNPASAEDADVGGTVTATGPTELGVTVALTLEPKPGATAPTLPILTLGTAEQPGS